MQAAPSSEPPAPVMAPPPLPPPPPEPPLPPEPPGPCWAALGRAVLSASATVSAIRRSAPEPLQNDGLEPNEKDEGDKAPSSYTAADGAQAALDCGPMTGRLRLLVLARSCYVSHPLSQPGRIVRPAVGLE